MIRIQGFPQVDPSRFDAGTAAARRTQSGQPEFLDTLKSTLGQVENLQAEAQTRVASMLQGTGEDVHSAMIAVEKADLAFQLMLQVRNKIVQAYQEVSRMPF